MIQSAVADMPMDTAESSFAMRISVGTETSSRAAHARSSQVSAQLSQRGGGGGRQGFQAEATFGIWKK